LKFTRQRFQRGSLRRVRRSQNQWAWEYRYKDPATQQQKSMYLSCEQFPSQALVERHLEAFVLKLNCENPILAVHEPTFGAVIDRFIDRIDAMKIDTEGFEGFVLAGMPKALERHRPAIVLEVSQTTRSTFPTAQAFTALFPQNYEFYLISDHTMYRTWRLMPIKPENFFDRFGNVLAIPHERRGLVAHTITPAMS